jgi:hypothetical protein
LLLPLPSKPLERSDDAAPVAGANSRHFTPAEGNTLASIIGTLQSIVTLIELEQSIVARHPGH